jgi:hypothetical protein
MDWPNPVSLCPIATKMIQLIALLFILLPRHFFVFGQCPQGWAANGGVYIEEASPFPQNLIWEIFYLSKKH